MKPQYIVMAAMAAAAVIVGSVFTAYQLYRLVGVDAETRGLKHPKLWGAFSLSGNGGSGLLLYLIGRRRYPVVSESAEQRALKGRYQKRLGVSLTFQAAGAVVCVLAVLLGGQAG